MKKRHLILGSSAAGIGVLNKLRKLCPDDDITCLTAQHEMPYNTCLLADYLCEGTPPAALWTKTASFFEQNNITLHRDSRALSIDTQRQRVTCANGQIYPFDTLFIGTGTSQRWLPTEKPVQSRLFGFQTLTDTNAMHNFIITEHPKTALVIGAGLSGVECADALNERGIKTTLIEYGNHLLPTLINQAGSHAIEWHMKKAGITFYAGCRVQQILINAAGHTVGAQLDDDNTFMADMVVVAIGATPNSQLGDDADLTLHGDSIAVNNHMQTSHTNIFSGGDVAAVPVRNTSELIRSCTWPDAMQQGMFAARGMAGEEKVYPGVTVVLSSHFFETQFVSCGPVTNPPSAYTVHEESGDDWYSMLLTHENKLKGFLLVDKLERVGELRRLVSSGEAFAESSIAS